MANRYVFVRIRIRRIFVSPKTKRIIRDEYVNTPYSFVFVFVEYEYSSVLFVYIRITAELTVNANIRMDALVSGQDRAI
jgi:hypothetical protein